MPFTKGHPSYWTPESLKKVSETRKKMDYSWMIGKKATAEQRKKRSQRMIETGFGKWNKGIKRSDETKKKLSEACKKNGIGKWMKNRLGVNSNNWKGGIANEPYSVDWTETLKKSIRQRDRYSCQNCGSEPSVQVHHIDYNKKNCDPNNLITLCKSCHMRTNDNRKSWEKYFTEAIISKYKKLTEAK